MGSLDGNDFHMSRQEVERLSDWMVRNHSALEVASRSQDHRQDAKERYCADKDCPYRKVRHH